MLQAEEEEEEAETSTRNWSTEQFDGEWISGSTASAAGGCPEMATQIFVPADRNIAAETKILVPAPVFDTFSQSPQFPFEVTEECEVGHACARFYRYHLFTALDL